MGLGISLIAVSNFGNGPWDAVNIGLSEKNWFINWPMYEYCSIYTNNYRRNN